MNNFMVDLCCQMIFFKFYQFSETWYSVFLTVPLLYYLKKIFANIRWEITSCYFIVFFFITSEVDVFSKIVF